MSVNFYDSSSDHLKRFLDNEIFFGKMSDFDLRVRESKSREDYLEKYKNGILSFTPEDRQKVMYDLNRIIPFEPLGLRYIPWNLVKLSQSLEGGMCHTLGSYIMLSEEWFRRNSSDREYILMHEKIHIFQKRHPNETDQWIQQHMGFFPQTVPYQGRWLDNLRRIRNNPDLNGRFYGYRPGEVFMELYHEEPKTIHDSQPYAITQEGQREVNHQELKIKNCVSQLEHPYEMMASYLARLILNACPSVSPETKNLHLYFLSHGPNIL